MDLTFQVPMQYCSLQHRILLLSPVPSTIGWCFCFGSIPSFFLELFLYWSPVAYWAPTDLGSSSFSVISFCLFILFMGFLVMSDSLRPHGLCSPWNSPGQNTGVGSLSLLQGIFPTWGSNPGLPHCRHVLYHLSLHIYGSEWGYTCIPVADSCWCMAKTITIL